MKDPYAALDVERTASIDEIKKAYRKLAKANHPDLHPGDAQAADRFKEIGAAYEILSDERKRAHYDRFGSFEPGAMPPPGAGGRVNFDFGGGPWSGPGGVENLGGGIEELLGSFFGGGAAVRERGSEPGEDLTAAVAVPFRVALEGTTLELRVDRLDACGRCGGRGETPLPAPVKCPECDGRGQVKAKRGPLAFARPCAACRGTGTKTGTPCPACTRGRVRASATVKARIPTGVDTGTRLRLPGQGNAGSGGGARGDLYLQVTVEPHPLWGRAGDALTLEWPVSFAEAALGAKLEIPTPGGTKTIRIPPGTQPGQQLRVRESGIPLARGGTGDLIVTVKVEVPKLVDADTRDLLAKLDQELGAAQAREELLKKAAV